MNPEILATAHAAPHLTEDDLDEILLDSGAPAAFEHLADCEACSRRLTAFRAEMAVFNQASFAWSEARSNTISRDLKAHRPALLVTPTALWSCTMALVLAVTLGINTGVQHRNATLEAANTPAQSIPSEDLPEQQIATDNAMLAAIDSEISSPKPAQLGIYETGTDVARHSTVRQVRD